MSSPWSPAAAPDLAAHTEEIFLAPYVGANAGIHLQNTGNSHPNCMYDATGRERAAYNISGPLDDKARQILVVQDTRMIAPTQGNTVIRERSPETAPGDAGAALLADGLVTREQAQIVDRADPLASDYIRYLVEHGFLPADQLGGLLFVHEVIDYDEVLRVTAASGRPAVPYNPAPDFVTLCGEYGVEVIASGSPELALFNHKTEFRDYVDRIRPGTFRYSRVRLQNGERAKPVELTNLIEYSERLDVPATDGPRPVLFVQKAVSGGGNGNYLIARAGSGFEVPGRRWRFDSLDALADFIAELGDAEVTPYLPVQESPSIGLVIGRSGVSVVGPFHQILNETKDYVGFRLDLGGALTGFGPEAARLWQERSPWLIELAREVANHARGFGYLGYASLDMMVYREADGELCLSIAETNLRYTGTCALQMMVHSAPDLRERYLAGELSILAHNLVGLSPAIESAVEGRTTRVAALLRTAGVPLVDSDHRRGVVLVARPAGGLGGTAVGVAVIADDDAQREHWLNQARSALSHAER